MWELLNRYKGMDIWRGRDAEGRTCYSRTYPWADGGSVQPTGVLKVYSLKAIRAVIDEDVKADALIEGE